MRAMYKDSCGKESIKWNTLNVGVAGGCVLW